MDQYHITVQVYRSQLSICNHNPFMKRINRPIDINVLKTQEPHNLKVKRALESYRKYGLLDYDES